VTGRLYDTGEYPGAVYEKDGTDIVIGEVYEIIDESLLVDLDDYEDCLRSDPEPHEYRRIVVPVFTDTKKPHLAFFYQYNLEVEQHVEIKSGDYLKYRDKTV